MNNCGDIIKYHVGFHAVKILRSLVKQDILIYADVVFNGRFFCDIEDHIRKHIKYEKK